MGHVRSGTCDAILIQSQVIRQAQKERGKGKRTQILDDAGLCAEDYIFDDGNLIENFALSRRFVPGIDWLNGCSQDAMHTSFVSGPVAHEGYYLNYSFIRIRGYFSRKDLNDARLAYEHWPPGQMVPSFEKYVEEGIKGTVPDPSGKFRNS